MVEGDILFGPYLKLPTWQLTLLELWCPFIWLGWLRMMMKPPQSHDTLGLIHLEIPRCWCNTYQRIAKLRPEDGSRYFTWATMTSCLWVISGLSPGLQTRVTNSCKFFWKIAQREDKDEAKKSKVSQLPLSRLRQIWPKQSTWKLQIFVQSHIFCVYNAFHIMQRKCCLCSI